jgi:DNA polymerase-3 subunit delta'
MAFTPDLALAYLEKAWKRNRLAHAYLVVGLDAPGRDDIALRIIHMLHGASDLSLESMAAAGVHVVRPQSKSRQILIREIRELDRTMYQRAQPGRLKIGVIADADRMTVQATNAFLKTLEEPPAGSLLLLLTDQPARLLDTVRSRCLQIVLHDPATEAAGTARPESDRQLLEALAGHFSRPPGPGGALAFCRLYSSLLAGVKAEIGAACESDRQTEAARYGKSTDAAAWLKDREDYFEDLAHSRYLEHRQRTLGLVLRWFGDLLRHHTRHPRLAFPQFATVIELAAARHDPADLLRRLRCLEDLQHAYDTNVNEALATELALLGALG